MRKEELVARVVRKLIEIAPDVLETTLVESGAMQEIVAITEEYQESAPGGI